MTDGFFDANVARTYDLRHETDPELIATMVGVLHELAGDGAALEFAIGTGRIALPLSERGVAVSGIELSQAMVDQLRLKDGGQSIDVLIGDMTTTTVEGSFSLVFLVYNTIDNLVTQDAQVACFQNAAAHLEPGGRFLIETLVPPLQRLPVGETKLAFDCSPDHWGMDEFDVTTQNYTSHHAWFSDGSANRNAVPFRYAWPAELDLMAKMAGLELEHRWDDWDRTPFNKLSAKHISVWRKPSA